MSRILRCECGFYTSFGHSGGFPRIWIPDVPAKEKIEACEKGEADPFYVYHTACPQCNKPFRPWYSNDENDPLFLLFDEFVKKMLVDADVFVVSQLPTKGEQNERENC